MDETFLMVSSMLDSPLYCSISLILSAAHLMQLDISLDNVVSPRVQLISQS